MPNGEYDLTRVYWWEQRWREGVQNPQQPRQVVFEGEKGQKAEGRDGNMGSVRSKESEATQTSLPPHPTPYTLFQLPQLRLRPLLERRIIQSFERCFQVIDCLLLLAPLTVNHATPQVRLC